MDSIYGSHLDEMNSLMEEIDDSIRIINDSIYASTGIQPIEHFLSRIKSEESMREKCRRLGIPENEESALSVIHDAIGVRIVCAFLSDVYIVRDHLTKLPGVEIIQEKDYIKNVKPNGYRSLHLIIKQKGLFAEIQLRTVSMDTWAALEHHMRYKKNIGGNKALIEKELKRCADELSSTDISMQAIRDMIFEQNGEHQ